MRGGKQLLLLAAFVLLARCQQKPQVSMLPAFNLTYSGDLFYLSCDNIASGSRVTWYLNGVEKPQTNKTWKMVVTSPEDSGSYQCESNGLRSDNFAINVLEYAPSASLIIKTGQPVMRTGASVILQLDNEDGLRGWNCWVYRGGVQTRRIKLKLEENSVRHVFQPNALYVFENMFWCTDRAGQNRSNQITVRTSEKDVSLEMYPLPAVAGESLTLRCLVWGTNQIESAVFYKDDAVILRSASPTYEIPKVTESETGKYKCDATYTYTARTAGPQYQVVSDNQDVFVRAPTMKADLSANNGLWCSCPRCPSDGSYRWYHKNDDNQPWALLDSGQGFMMPKASGTYACRAVWNKGRSFLSSGYVFSDTPPITSILTSVVIVVLVITCVTAFCIYYNVIYKRRNTTGPIYEDVALRTRGKDDYETLQKQSGAEREGEYHTLHPEAMGTRGKEGEYEPLNKREMQEGVYHTVRMEGAAGGDGGYEALKKEGMKEGVYHTLGIEGAAGGEGRRTKTKNEIVEEEKEAKKKEEETEP